MGRIAAHTDAEVFEVADRLLAEGKDVTPTALREALGRGSFSTLGRHIEAWRQQTRSAAAPVVIEMPQSVQAAFAACWQAAASEAGKEIATVREKADADVQAAQRRLAEALLEIERLEGEASAGADELDRAKAELASIEAQAQQAAQREAGLRATVEQMRQQIEAQQAEAKHLHQALADAGAKLEALGERERGHIEQAAKAKAEAERLADQLKEQKAQSLEVMAKLESDLCAARKDARDSAERLGRAAGELEALRAQAVRRQTQVEKDKPSARISS